MLQLCIVFYKYKDSRLYNDDFATLHTNKYKGKCSLYICQVASAAAIIAQAGKKRYRGCIYFFIESNKHFA